MLILEQLILLVVDTIIWDAGQYKLKVQVLDSIPSTNVTVHTFDSAVSNKVKKKKIGHMIDQFLLRVLIYISCAVSNATYAPGVQVYQQQQLLDMVSLMVMRLRRPRCIEVHA